MSVRNLAKRTLLLIPQIRRLYEFALSEAARAREAEQLIVRKRSEYEQSTTRAEHERRQLQNENARIEDELVRLQSDYKRSAAHAEELRIQLRDAELRREVSERLGELKAQQCADLEVRHAATYALWRADLEARLARPPAIAADIKCSHARLLGGLSMLTAELAELRRSIGPGQRNEGTRLNWRLRMLYLDLLETAVSGRLYDDPSITPGTGRVYDPQIRTIGRDWPSRAPTMISTARLRNIRTLAASIIEDAIEGDFLEAGVWRGGACIYMRGILAAYEIRDRKVFVAASFADLPMPQPDLYPADLGDQHHAQPELAVPLAAVEGNFDKFGLLDDQVVFLPGWFKDTLATAPIERLALLRLDGDMYGSTMETLKFLYQKVSVGGYVVIDDFTLGPCRQAVEDFRRDCGCSEPLRYIDGAAIFWQKAG